MTKSDSKQSVNIKNGLKPTQYLIQFLQCCKHFGRRQLLSTGLGAFQQQQQQQQKTVNTVSMVLERPLSLSNKIKSIDDGLYHFLSICEATD